MSQSTTWTVEGRKKRLLHRTEIVYKRTCDEKELPEEVKRAVRHGADSVRLERAEA